MGQLGNTRDKYFYMYNLFYRNLLKPGTLKFLFAVHNHQPVGNFGHVFEETFEKCYRPYLETLSQFPGLKTSAHFSGPLLEWIEAHRPDYLKQMRNMVEAGQLEILGGGFYEPLLATIPEDDALGQIRMMNDFILDKFGIVPRGLWLAERIWSPTLPRVIARAGIEFTILDDTHFSYSGLEDQDIHGYYITESQGYPLNLFPISKELRYSIPFDLPGVTLDKLRDMQDERQCKGLTYADDGEKFGSWPETWEWVYGERYLEKFFQSLQDNQENIETLHFGEYLDQHPPTGRVYLPPASYEEMMEWALPVHTSRELHHLKQEMDEKGIDASISRRFIRGGQWDNFLAKYPASNRMHKRMLLASRKVSQLPESHPGKAEALRRLYKAQCNCSYWHGMFGGLYLNYLRHAVYENLIQAHALATRGLDNSVFKIEPLDYDLDGQDELLIHHPEMTTIIAPARGGAIVEFDFHPASFNITNVLERSEEAYHQVILDHAGHADDSGEQPQSIHDRVKFKQEGLESFLVYDRQERLSLQDYFVPADISVEQIKSGSYEDLGKLAGQPFHISPLLVENNANPSLKLSRKTELGSNRQPVELIKNLAFPENEASIHVRYELINQGDQTLQGLFGVEFNVSLLAGDAPDRYFVDDTGEFSNKPLVTEGEALHRKYWGMRDEWSGIEISWSLDQAARTLFYPVETVSQSEDGFEKTYQGTCLWFLWDVALQPGEKTGWEVVWKVTRSESGTRG